jgi:CubicO group peptidase (beta-lactamase class C family)
MTNPHRRLRPALALLVFVLAVHPAASQSRPAKPTRPLDGLDAWIQEALVKAKGVGLAIAVVKDDSIVYARGFGVKELGDPAPVTPRSRFAIGSTTKAFTAAALGLLVDEGRLSWDDRAIDHLKGFELYDPAVTRELTVRDLVTHRSGLPRGDRLWMGSSFSRPEVLRRIRYLEPRWSLRATFGYQNVMYLAAGEVIPAVTGQSWDQFLRERIFLPLGMTATSTSVRGLDQQPDVATPHDLRDGKITPIRYRNIDNIGPAGSINSNVLDLAQWIRVHLNGGTLGGREMWKPATHRELFTPQMWVRLESEAPFLYGDAHFLAYGLGWFLFDRAGRKVAEHSGGIDGMITELILVPEEKLGVVVLSNHGGSPVAFPVGHTVVDRYLGLTTDRLGPMVQFLATIEAQRQKQEDSVQRTRAKDSRPSLALEAYTGTYDDPMYGPATVGRENGKLVFSGGGLIDALDLEHWHHDTFRGTWRDPIFGKAMLTFRLNPDGSVGGLKVDGLEAEFTRRSATLVACEPTTADRSRLASRPSPYDSVAIRIGDQEAKACYSRPSMRGRVVFGSDLVPYDTLWRTGANDPTIIHLPFPAEIAGLRVGPGKYSIYTVPGRERWLVVVNRSTTQGGLTRDEGQFRNEYTDQVRAQEVGRAPVAAEALAEPIERLTLRSETAGADGAVLLLEWERTRVRIPIRRAG